jgi:iduronate 2-sulfatase
VLFIAIDDLRPVLGCYGGQALTPHIDALAASSRVFQRHYVQWPVCGASRASLLSGQRPKTHGGFSNATATQIVTSRPDTAPTLPYHFKQAGYETLGFGKVYHSLVNYPGAGWSQPPWTPPMHWSLYVNATPAQKRGDYQPASEIYDGPDYLHGDYQTTSRVLEALESSAGKPFCIFAGLSKPHLPYVAPQKYLDLYRNTVIKAPEFPDAPYGSYRECYNFSEIWAYGAEGRNGRPRLFSPELPPNPRQAIELTRAYYACVSFADAQVGRMLKKLRELGLEQDTAVVLWGDHGYHLGDLGRWSKGTQYEADMRSPLIIRLPGMTAGASNTRALVETVDIYPTLAEYCGLPKPRHVDGTSLVPLVSGKKARIKETALSEFIPIPRPAPRPPDNGGPPPPPPPMGPAFMIYSLRSEEYRYVQWRDRDQGMKLVREELFDLRETLSETRNLAGAKRYQKTLREHRALMKREHPDY